MAQADDLAGSANAAGNGFSLRNKLINGNFNINQRTYVTGAATGVANQYTLDRWRVVTSGQNLAFAASGTGNQVTAPAGGLEQVIEAQNMEAGTYCLSWVGTATATINGNAITNGATAVLPANTAATVRFTGGTVATAQLERAPGPSPFEFRPVSVELNLCQRYYEKSFAMATAPAQNVGAGTGEHRFLAGKVGALSMQSHLLSFMTRKRAVPTVVLYNPAAANAQVRDITAGVDCSASAASSALENGINITLTGNALTAVGNTLGIHWTAEAEL